MMQIIEQYQRDTMVLLLVTWVSFADSSNENYQAAEWYIEGWQHAVRSACGHRGAL